MFWDKLSQKERIGLSISFAFLALAFLDRLIIGPIKSKFRRVDQEILISEKQLGSDLRNINQKEFIAAEYEKYFEYIKRSGSDDEEVTKILGEIESLARKSSVYLGDMKPRKPREVNFNNEYAAETKIEGQMYKEYIVEIESEGQMPALVQLLHQLNTSTQILRVEKLRLSPTKNNPDILKASMLITRVLAL